MFGKDSSAGNFKTVSIMLLILMAAGTIVAGQKSKHSVWYYPSFGGEEKGAISELKDKRRVYVSYFIASPLVIQDPRQISYQQRIQNLLTRDGVLEVVSKPEDAELAIHINSSNGLFDFYVLTRGAQKKDGGYKPRLILKRLRSDSADSTAIIEQAISAFIDDLKRVRGQK
jgi:hypothetical protein